jgi:glyoxylase-like metal-dependent hydrolase (beta-lactamase superfamily II)
VNSVTQEAEFAEGGAAQIKTFASRSPMTAKLLEDAVRRPADITFERDYTLELGGLRVRLVVVGPTHTRGDTGIFVEGDRVLFSGDVVMNESFVNAGQNASMKAWLAAFDIFEAFGATVVVPSHGPVGDGSLIATNRAFMQAIQARARDLKAQGQTVDAVATTVQAEMTARHPTWARANGVAGAARAAYNEAP